MDILTHEVMDNLFLPLGYRRRFHREMFGGLKYQGMKFKILLTLCRHKNIYCNRNVSLIS